jgi:subtilisin family serine protease
LRVAANDPFRASVYCDTDEQRRFAIDVLSEVNPNEVQVFDEAVEGWVRPDQLAVLTRAGLLVDAVAEPEITPVTSAALAARVAPGVAARRSFAGPGPSPAEEDALAGFGQMAQMATLSADDGWFVVGQQALEAVEEQARVADKARVARKAPAAVASSVAGKVPRARAAVQATDSVDVFRVRFTGPLRSSQRKTLKSLGLEALAAEPGNVLLMYLTPAQQDELRHRPFVAGLEPYGFEAAVTPELLDAVKTARTAELAAGGAEAGLLSDSGEAAEVPDTYDVICQRPDDVAVVGSIVAGTAGTEILGTSDIMVRVKLTLGPAELQAFLSGLAHLPQVAKLSPYETPTLYCDLSRRLIGVERVNEAAATPFTGEGEIVAVFDSGIDDTHPDLADRILVHETLPGAATGDVVGHGSHVAGLVAGTGAASKGKITGMAPGAELAVFGVVGPGGKLALPPDLGQLLQHAVDAGAKIVNLSWGVPLPGPYEGYSMTLDKFLRAHPDVLVVVAAGNSGKAPKGTLTFNTVGTPATAKNVLTVGACQSDRPGFTDTWGKRKPRTFPLPPASDEPVAGNPDRTANVSSRGPTDYESVKPDLVAPGTFILSARAAAIDPSLPWQDCPDFDNRYVYIGGTSMAAPIVAGAAALVRQYLRVARATPAPSSALVKAILLAGAKRLPSMRTAGSPEDVGYPDFDQGYGRLDLATILPTADSPGRRLAFVDVPNDSPEALESRTPAADGSRSGKATYTVKVAKGATSPLRVVLTWTDFAAVHVQNNLELVVTGPGLPIAVGNGENSFGKSSLFHPAEQEEFAGVTPDPANNVEHVTVPTPKPGEYRIRVIAENTPFPPQGFAVCVAGDLDADSLVRA